MPSDPKQTRDRWSPSVRGVAMVTAAAVLLVVLALAFSVVDVLAVLVLCGGVVLLERTVGDWLADRLGDAAGKVVFAAAIGAMLWGLLGTEQGRAAALALLEAGDARGFHSEIVARTVTRPPPPARPPAPARHATPALATPHLPGDRAVSSGSGAASGPDVRAVGGRAPGTLPAGPAPARVTVRAIPSDQPRRIVLYAEVTSGPDKVAEGIVEFSLNGTVVARVPLESDGSAEARMANLATGYYRVTARFAGTDRFTDSSSETSFSI